MEEDFFKELLKTEGIPLDPAKDAEYAPLSSAEQNHSVHEVFSMYPELAHIGTEEEYSSYLATVFPETKVPDIVWHNSPDMIPEFKKQEEGAGQFHFAKGKESTWNSFAGEKIEDRFQYAVKLHITNPKIEAFNEDDHFGQTHLMRFLPEQGYDGVLVENDKRPEDSERVVFQQKQIHILGSQTDIENFKEFVSQSKE